MKRVKYFIMLLVIPIMMGGCKKGELGVVSFDQSAQVSFTFPHSTILDLPQILTPAISTNWEGNFANHNTDKDHLREMKLKSMVMTVKNPPGKTFDFLQSIEIYIQADGLQETKIAYANNIPSNIGQTLTLTPVDVDISPYAKKDNFKLRVNTKMSKYNPDDVDVQTDMVFRITANVLN